MPWCHQATSNQLIHCFPRSMLPYGETIPQLTDTFRCNGNVLQKAFLNWFLKIELWYYDSYFSQVCLSGYHWQYVTFYWRYGLVPSGNKPWITSTNVDWDQSCITGSHWVINMNIHMNIYRWIQGITMIMLFIFFFYFNFCGKFIILATLTVLSSKFYWKIVQLWNEQKIISACFTWGSTKNRFLYSCDLRRTLWYPILWISHCLGIVFLSVMIGTMKSFFFNFSFENAMYYLDFQ